MPSPSVTIKTLQNDCTKKRKAKRKKEQQQQKEEEEGCSHSLIENVNKTDVDKTNATTAVNGSGNNNDERGLG